jgi:hypothetical protein
MQDRVVVDGQGWTSSLQARIVRLVSVPAEDKHGRRHQRAA